MTTSEETKAKLPAFAEAKRAAFNALKKEYLAQLDAEIEKAGGMAELSRLLGMSPHFIRMVKLRGGLKNLKNCVELIAQKLYGWNPKVRKEGK